MKPDTALAQLRHAYAHLAAGRVVDQKQFADGLIAPVIAMLESMDPAAIADQVVPEYRSGSYSCCGVYAKRWQAAYDGACVALGRN